MVRQTDGEQLNDREIKIEGRGADRQTEHDRDRNRDRE